MGQFVDDSRQEGREQEMGADYKEWILKAKVHTRSNSQFFSPTQPISILRNNSWNSWHESEETHRWSGGLLATTFTGHSPHSISAQAPSVWLHSRRWWEIRLGCYSLYSKTVEKTAALHEKCGCGHDPHWGMIHFPCACAQEVIPNVSPFSSLPSMLPLVQVEVLAYKKMVPTYRSSHPVSF